VRLSEGAPLIIFDPGKATVHERHEKARKIFKQMQDYQQHPKGEMMPFNNLFIVFVNFVFFRG